jgi:ribosomal protein S18 acetylase RimI-like enzyme
MEIRVLIGEDTNQYWRLRLEALQNDSEAFTESAEEHQSLSLEETKSRIAATEVNFIVGAFEDGRLVGTVGFYRERGLKTRHKGRVWGVYVTPSHRGTGIGKRMMKDLLSRAASLEGVEQISLSVAKTQTAAQSLYRSLGFECFGCEPNALKIGEKVIDEELLILRLRRGAGHQDAPR